MNPIVAARRNARIGKPRGLGQYFFGTRHIMLLTRAGRVVFAGGRVYNAISPQTATP